MQEQKPISHQAAELIEKTIVDRRVTGHGVMSGTVTETYRTSDGRVLTHTFGNGGGDWKITSRPRANTATPVSDGANGIRVS